ncbi:MAG: metallophosphoesterase, partial [Oleispira sp.]|nr:metallophosphoesterase [Oleispira sp.]
MKQQFNISHLLIVFLLFNVQVFAQQKTSLKFIVAPYLTHMTDNSFQVSWETSEAVKGTIYLAESEYDTFEPEFKIAATENTKTHFHRLFIHDLSANELYHYQVINSGKNGDTLKGPVTPITIANYTQSAISFSVVGDTQGNPVVWQRIAELMAQKNPQFIVHVGDLVQYGPNKDDWTDEFFKPANNLLSYTPLYPAIGNHEMNDEKFYEYFGLPFDDAFYSIKKGELILIFVDTNKDILPGSEQYRKLEHLLASSQEQWKIVVHHHPIFTSDKNSYRSSLMAASTKGDPNITHLKNLYVSYAVDLTLSGHVHGYERTLPILKNHINKEEGVTHIVSGGGGGRFKRIPYENNWFLAEALHENHYLNISIRENKLQVEAIDTTGVIFDSWKKEKILGHANLSTPLINATKKYFIDSTSVSIENTNKSKSINYRLNEGGYNTAFRNVNSLILYNTTTVS